MMNNINKKASAYRIGQMLVVVLASISVSQLAWGAAPPTKITKFSNLGSIANTRHNMTQNTTSPDVSANMNSSRNDYGAVCVYCHTPHSANQTIAAPLWNRTIKVTNYQTYDELGTTTLTQTVMSTPGPASLTCLSCHDGQTAIDSVINMPGSGMGNNNQATTQNTAFLDSWPAGGGGPTEHAGLNSTNGVLGSGTGENLACPGGPGNAGGDPTCVEVFPGAGFYFLPAQGCLTCHSDVGVNTLGGAGNIVDFRLFNIGTDLRNDHPVGITFPTTNGPGTDWNTPAGVQGASLYFDENSNGRMEKGEIRTYSGNVECASCHDPHGVPDATNGGVFNPTFLRKPQNQDSLGSAVCLTCHVK